MTGAFMGMTGAFMGMTGAFMGMTGDTWELTWEIAPGASPGEMGLLFSFFLALAGGAIG